MNTLIILYLISIPIPFLLTFSKYAPPYQMKVIIGIKSFIPIMNTILTIGVIYGACISIKRFIKWYFKRRRLLKKYKPNILNEIELYKHFRGVGEENDLRYFKFIYLCEHRAYNRLKFGYKNKTNF